MAGVGRSKKEGARKKAPNAAPGSNHRRLIPRQATSAETTTPPPASMPPESAPTAGATLLGVLTPGTILGNGLVIKQAIGKGGAGIVFEALDRSSGQSRAVKALLPQIATNRNAIWRFSREARLTAAMEHPNIIRVLGIEQHENIYFIVEELLHGITFGEFLRRQGRLRPLEALECLVPIMGALAAAHQKGIIHRDVKPDNIFLVETSSKSPLSKLIDFGIAKMASERGAFDSLVTEIDAYVGTPAYMSPEQATPGAELDARTDIWSMGVVLFEALSGERAFHSTERAVLFSKIKNEQLRSLSTAAPQLSPELVTIVDRALRRAPAQRFSTMAEMLSAILRYVETEDQSFGSRHIRSMPSGLMPSFEGSAVRNSDPSELRPSTATSDDEEEGPSTSRDLSAGVLAEQALKQNELDSAVKFADEAIAEYSDQAALRGRMRLVQAAACRWLGRFLEAERHAEEARRLLPQHGAAWFAASSHFVVVLANMGKREPLEELVGELARIEVGDDVAAAGAQIQALGQGVISLMRLGREGQAHRAFDTARKLAQSVPYDADSIRIWLDLAEAEIGLHAADHMKFLRFVEDAVDSFTEKNDLKNACICHANVGNALIQLGDFHRAERELRTAIRLGEPMLLGSLALVRANLGFTLARLDRLDEAKEIVDQASRSCPEQSYIRFLSICQIYRAEIYRLQGFLHEAKAHAETGVHLSASIRAIHAFALAVLGNILLQQNQHGAALRQSSEATEILTELSGVEEGDALIRLVHVRALLARGERTRARIHLLEARRRLESRAEQISDPKLRRKFLENVPENRATLELNAGLLEPSEIDLGTTFAGDRES